MFTIVITKRLPDELDIELPIIKTQGERLLDHYMLSSFAIVDVVFTSAFMVEKVL